MQIELNKEYLSNDDHSVKHIDGALHLKIVSMNNGKSLPITAQQIHPNPLYDGTKWYLTLKGKAMMGNRKPAFRLVSEVK